MFKFVVFLHVYGPNLSTEKVKRCGRGVSKGVEGVVSNDVLRNIVLKYLQEQSCVFLCASVGNDWWVIFLTSLLIWIRHRSCGSRYPPSPLGHGFRCITTSMIYYITAIAETTPHVALQFGGTVPGGRCFPVTTAASPLISWMVLRWPRC